MVRLYLQLCVFATVDALRVAYIPAQVVVDPLLIEKPYLVGNEVFGMYPLEQGSFMEGSWLTNVGFPNHRVVSVPWVSYVNAHRQVGRAVRQPRRPFYRNVPDGWQPGTAKCRLAGQSFHAFAAPSSEELTGCFVKSPSPLATYNPLAWTARLVQGSFPKMKLYESLEEAVNDRWLVSVSEDYAQHGLLYVGARFLPNLYDKAGAEAIFYADGRPAAGRGAPEGRWLQRALFGPENGGAGSDILLHAFGFDENLTREIIYLSACSGFRIDSLAFLYLMQLYTVKVARFVKNHSEEARELFPNNIPSRVVLANTYDEFERHLPPHQQSSHNVLNAVIRMELALARY